MSGYSYNPNQGPAAGSATAQPTWWKVTLSHTAFQTAALTNSITAFTLPARAVVHTGMVKHSVQFAGTMATYTISLGIGSGASAAKYALANNVLAAVGDAAFSSLAAALPPDLPSFSGTTTVTATATSTVTNLSTSTAGSVDIWLLVSVLP